MKSTYNSIQEEEFQNPKEVRLEGDETLVASYSSKEGSYPVYNIRIEHGFYTVYELKRKYCNHSQRIILDSEFQRENVWKPLQKAELVESILMGLPLPIFYFNQDKQGRLIVVDGRQRLTALFEYMDDQWPLKGLNVLKELNGKKFSELNPITQSQIEDYQIQAHVILPPTPDRIKFDIFDRVNRAGTQLNKQEIRNALYQGKATKFLKKIVESDAFTKATGDAFAKNSRMKDKYIVLRYIAFHLYFEGRILQYGEKYVYKDDIDELLGLTMEYMNEMSDSVLKNLYDSISNSLEKIYVTLGKDAFRLVSAKGKKTPINMNVFEVLMYLMSKVSQLDKQTKDLIALKVATIKDKSEFRDAIGDHRDNWTKVKKRFRMMDEILEEVYDKQI